jgi:DNA primase
LRHQLDFEAVLRHYGVEVKRKGDQHHGYCPLPTHEGTRNSPSFSANLPKGIFNCFGCGAGGNAIDFAARMEGLDPGSGADVRKAALILIETFALAPPKREKKPKPQAAAKPEPPSVEDAPREETTIVNAPLDFELKQLDPEHPYLDKRAFSRETIARFGLGFCSKGLLKDRIAIPLHNREGKLVGYAGRLVDDRLVSEESPKYLFPGKRTRNGVLHEFKKTHLLYNSDRLTSPVNDLVIVEGFASVWWLTQMDVANVVALMGWAMSEEQADIVTELVPPSGRIWVMPDGDRSGVQCAESVFERLGPARFLQWFKLDEGKQPTDYPGGFIRKRLLR